MMTKITVTFSGGSRQVLKSPCELENIDKNREAKFVMDNLQVYQGYCDGEVDEYGDFCIMQTIHGIGLPFKRLLGWRYVTPCRNKKGAQL